MSLSGAFTSSVVADPGHVSLYELNVDRSGTVDFHAGAHAFENAGRNHPDLVDEHAVAYYRGLNPRAHSFVVKDGTRMSFKTVTTHQFNASSQFGDHIYKKYPLTSSLHREYYYSTTNRQQTPNWQATPSGQTLISSGSITHLFALKNTLNDYVRLSPHYAYSSSRGELSWNKHTQHVNLISIPSIFYGSEIEKGTVDLKYYITGTLIGQLQDLKRNGDLVQVGPRGSTGSGSVAGSVLYDQGFIILTGSWALSSSTKEQYKDSAGDDFPRWIHFASCIADGHRPGDVNTFLTAPNPPTPSSSYNLSFNGTTRTPTLTMMAHAKKGTLNHSNNPTYIKFGEFGLAGTGSNGYVENGEMTIKNILKTPYNDPTGSFKKITYITKVGIYDEDRNLIGIAKLANPVKKTEDRDFTFKLKIDL
tara:strand:- start:13904 stop:15160 length:1257 start_codon:yes stop_codon:yes gene_type:complete